MGLKVMLIAIIFWLAAAGLPRAIPFCAEMVENHKAKTKTEKSTGCHPFYTKLKGINHESKDQAMADRGNVDFPYIGFIFHGSRISGRCEGEP